MEARVESHFFTVTPIEKLREAAETLNYQDGLGSVLEKMFGCVAEQGYTFVIREIRNNAAGRKAVENLKGG